MGLSIPISSFIMVHVPYMGNWLPFSLDPLPLILSLAKQNLNGCPSISQMFSVVENLQWQDQILFWIAGESLGFVFTSRNYSTECPALFIRGPKTPPLVSFPQKTLQTTRGTF